MYVSQENRASHADASALAPARHPQTVVLMHTSASTPANAKVLRILVPINANHDSHWGVRYALGRHREGKQVEVILLNIGQPINQGEAVEFRAQQEIDQFQLERAQPFIEKATKPLAAENIPCRCLFKQGDVVFSILDTAEELECDEIVMPEPKKGLTSIFSRDIVYAVMLQQRDVPIVAVNSDGMPPKSSRK